MNPHDEDVLEADSELSDDEIDLDEKTTDDIFGGDGNPAGWGDALGDDRVSDEN